MTVGPQGAELAAAPGIGDATWLRVLLAAVIPMLISFALIVALDRSPFTAELAGTQVPVTTADRLEEHVQTVADQTASTPIMVTAGDLSVATTPADLGLAVDVEATVSRTLQLRDTGRTNLSGALGRVQPVPVALTGAGDPGELRRISRALTVRPRDAELDLSGPALVPEVMGQTVTVEDLQGSLLPLVQQAIGAGIGPALTIPLTPAPAVPDVVIAELAPLLDTAESVADGVVTIVDLGGQPLTILQGSDVLGWVRSRAIDGRPTLEVNERRVPSPVLDSLRSADQVAADAAIVVDQIVLSPPDRDDPEDPERFGGTVRIEPEQLGVTIDTAATWDAVLAGAGPGDDAIVAVQQTDEPALTAASAASLGVVQPVSSFTTFYSSGQSRVTNIHRIAEIVDGVTILPGEAFELNHFVGERTRDRGFATGGAISGGEFITAVGGGVSQFATTFFNAAWFSGIDLVEFKPHSYYISRYPVGREATIDFPTVNLGVRNDTPHAIVVRTSVTGSSVTVTFWSTPYWTVQTDTGSRRRNGSGFRITVTRTRTAPGGSPESTPYTTDYRLQ